MPVLQNVTEPEISWLYICCLCPCVMPSNLLCYIYLIWVISVKNFFFPNNEDDALLGSKVSADS